MYVTEVVIAKLAEMRINKRGVAELEDASVVGKETFAFHGNPPQQEINDLHAGSSPAPATAVHDEQE